MKTTLRLFFLLISLPAVLFAELTDPGTYSATGQKPGTPAPVGYYVPTYGATTALAAPVGSYVPTTGASEPTPTEPGTFVAVYGASVPTPAAPGSYVSTYGASAAQPAPMGHFVATSGAANATPAPPGYYVSTEGATSAAPAPVGTYVPTEGATTALPVTPGYYVDGNPATMQTISPVGHFVATQGATAPTPAPAGYYVSAEGATTALAAPVGTYVPTTGASAPTPAEPGSFVSVNGASVPTPAAPGSYVPTYGASAAQLAPRGHFVDISGATNATPAPPGYYVATKGASAARSAPPGTYVPSEGASVAKSCPPGTTSYVASVACRIIDPAVSNNPPEIVGPKFAWLNKSPKIFSNESLFQNESMQISIPLSIQNESTELGSSSELTALTILSGNFIGDNSSYFSISNALPFTLYEGETRTLNVTYSGPTNQEIRATIYLRTDQYASIGLPGEMQTFDIAGNDADIRTFVPNNRERFDLYSSADIMEGQIGTLTLQPANGGSYQLRWNLESTTNLASGEWTSVSTNEITFNPEGQTRGFFRIRVQSAD